MNSTANKLIQYSPNLHKTNADLLEEDTIFNWEMSDKELKEHITNFTFIEKGKMRDFETVIINKVNS